MSITSQNDSEIDFQQVNSSDLILMEKDKQIISLIKANEELNKENDNIKQLSQNKDFEILSLKTDLSSLQSENKLYEKKIFQLNEKIKQLSNIIQEKENEKINQKESNDNQMQEITNVFNTHMKEYENVIGQSQQMEREINKLSGDLIDKEAIIASYQQMIFELKRENKKILILNKTLQEKEEIISTLSYQNEVQKAETQRVNEEMKEVKMKYSLYVKNMQNQSSSRGNIQNINEMFSSMQSGFKTQLEQKDKSFNDLKKLYAITNKENEKFIQFIIEQIKLMEKNIEINNVISNNFKNSKIDQIDERNKVKYDLIQKNFEILTKKIVQKRKNDLNQIQELRSEIKREKENREDIQKCYELHQNENIEAQSAISDINELITQKQKELDNINIKVEHLIRINEQLKKSNALLSEENQNMQKDMNDFCDNYASALSSFVSNNITQKDSKFPITSLPQFSVLDNLEVKKGKIMDSLHSLNSYINDLIDTASQSLQLVKNTGIDKDNIKNELENIKKEHYKEIEDMKESQNETIKQMNYLNEEKEALSSKLNEFSNIINDNQKKLQLFKLENEEINEKNKQLEHNLDLLTQSHYEMERNISLNEKSSNEKIETIENKNLQLLNEIQLKDMQIKSLEKLVHQLNRNPINNQYINKYNMIENPSEYAGKIVTRTQLEKIKSEKDSKSERNLNLFLSKFSPEFNVKNDNENNSFEEGLNLSDNLELSNNYNPRIGQVGKIIKSKNSKI